MANNSENSIILFPEVSALQEEIEKLRTEWSMLLLERDELTYTICKNIETKYMLLFGGLEYKALALDWEYRCLRRKIELIQARKNRQERIILADIEATVEKEFAEYQKRLDDQLGKMNEALERKNARVLSQEESTELKKRYRAVVKALHPDLHGDLTPAQARLFHNAVEAYKNGDLEGMRIIHELVSGSTAPEPTAGGWSALKEEKARMAELVRLVRERVEEIKREYPYILLPLIESEERIAEKKAELEDTIVQLKKACEIYRSRWEEMLGQIV